MIKSLVQYLDSSEAVLLMYLADELNLPDRHEVEQMLGTDGTLRRQLQQLQSAQHEVLSQLATLDAADPPPLSAAVSDRQVQRLMRQWQVDRLTRPSQPVPNRHSHLPAWSYPAVAAAVLVLALISWWGLHNQGQDPTLAQGPAPALTYPSLAVPGMAPAALVPAPSPVAILLPPSNTGSELAQDGSNPHGEDWNATIGMGVTENDIAEAERQASTLARRSDDANLTASIFMLGANEPME